MPFKPPWKNVYRHKHHFHSALSFKKKKVTTTKPSGSGFILDILDWGAFK